ncbi:hypothetical protein Rhe02_76920 [Rhizocola hellebori]|uniref:Uncharacterized protein n=1 Tax=Rhizocola hellebori TaxID=1392758 RepID=A0A8J3VKD4_9ACTN|nr:hypothetical protein Rhe02_76920 [Rhizocola hellebori]
MAGRVAIVLQGKVFTSFDTFSYAYRNDPAWDRGALVSFTGQAPRPWGVPLFFAMFSDDGSRAVGQWALGTLAWALLALSVAMFLRHRSARIAAMAAIVLLGLTRSVASWDFAILSESLSISLGVATLALFLWWLRTRALWPLVTMVVVAVWWMFTRLDMFVLAAPLGVALVWFVWRQRASGQPSSGRWRAAGAAAGVLVLLLAAGWSYAIGPKSVQTQVRWTADPTLSHERGLMMYRLRLSVFSDPQVLAAFQSELGMPGCAAVDQMVRTRQDWAIEEFARAVDTCPELRTWTDAHLTDLWSRYATTMPALFARQVMGSTGDSLTGAAYADVPALVPVPVEKMLFSKRFPLPITIAMLGLSLFLALFAGSRRLQPQLMMTGIAMAATALASVVLTVIVSSGEVWRFGIQETIAVRIAIIILLASALDSWLTSRHSAAPGKPS